MLHYATSVLQPTNNAYGLNILNLFSFMDPFDEGKGALIKPVYSVTHISSLS